MWAFPSLLGAREGPNLSLPSCWGPKQRKRGTGQPRPHWWRPCSPPPAASAPWLLSALWRSLKHSVLSCYWLPQALAPPHPPSTPIMSSLLSCPAPLSGAAEGREVAVGIPCGSSLTGAGVRGQQVFRAALVFLLP